MSNKKLRRPFGGTKRPTADDIRKARELARKCGPRAIAMLEAKEHKKEK